MAKEKGGRLIAQNKKAYHDYFIEESYEAGIELIGTEVKSIRAGKANLKDSYAEVRNGEIWVRNMHVSPYEQGNIFNKDPMRDRRLLLHKFQIANLTKYVTQSGYTMVPLSLYLKNGRVKVNIAVVRGKKNYDKRDALREKDAKRTIERELKDRYR